MSWDSVLTELIKAIGAVAVAWITARQRADRPETDCSQKQRKRPRNRRSR